MNYKRNINKPQNNEDNRNSRMKLLSSTTQIDNEFLSRDQWRNQEFCSGAGGWFQQIQSRTGDRENGDLGSVALLVRGSGGSCNLVQEISFHIVKFS